LQSIPYDENSIAHGAGSLYGVLQRLIASTASAWVLAIATVHAAWECRDPPVVLFRVHAPLSLLAGACAALAAAHPPRRARRPYAPADAPSAACVCRRSLRTCSASET